MLLCISPVINSAYGQITNGEVIYNVNMDQFYKSLEKKKETNSSLPLAFFQDISKAMENIQLELIFHKNKSVFKKIEGLAIDDTDQYYALASKYSTKGIYFTDLTNKEQILETGFQGNKNYLSLSIDSNEWTITKESKKIGEFICYKAVLIKNTPKGDTEVIAWFTPDIPIAFGPSEYAGNLPGLILELDDLLVSYKCSSINLKPRKKLEINWPKEIKTISEEEYKKKGDDLMKKISGN